MDISTDYTKSVVAAVYELQKIIADTTKKFVSNEIMIAPAFGYYYNEIMDHLLRGSSLSKPCGNRFVAHSKNAGEAHRILYNITGDTKNYFEQISERKPDSILP